jgi:hypothetical protein
LQQQRRRSATVDYVRGWSLASVAIERGTNDLEHAGILPNADPEPGLAALEVGGNQAR